MPTVRVREGISCVSNGVVLVAGKPFDADDPIVDECRWAFESDEIETASAEPGKKRSVRRP